MMNQLSLTAYTLLLSVLVAVAQAQFDQNYLDNMNYLSSDQWDADVTQGVKNVKRAATGM